MFGYFPTYQLGNVLSAQIWERLVSDLPDAYERVEQGSFGEIYEWLRRASLPARPQVHAGGDDRSASSAGRSTPSRTSATSRTRTPRWQRA